MTGRQHSRISDFGGRKDGKTLAVSPQKEEFEGILGWSAAPATSGNPQRSPERAKSTRHLFIYSAPLSKAVKDFILCFRAKGPSVPIAWAIALVIGRKFSPAFLLRLANGLPE